MNSSRLPGKVLEKLDENKIELDANEGGNCLHGGTKGFNQAIWLPIQETFNSSHLQLSHLSNDGDNGFPGNLLTTVSYTLTENNQLILAITAVEIWAGGLVLQSLSPGQ